MHTLAQIFFLERGQVCGIKACCWMDSPYLSTSTQANDIPLDIQMQDKIKSGKTILLSHTGVTPICVCRLHLCKSCH